MWHTVVGGLMSDSCGRAGAEAQTAWTRWNNNDGTGPRIFKKVLFLLVGLVVAALAVCGGGVTASLTTQRAPSAFFAWWASSSFTSGVAQVALDFYSGRHDFSRMPKCLGNSTFRWHQNTSLFTTDPKFTSGSNFVNYQHVWFFYWTQLNPEMNNTKVWFMHKLLNVLVHWHVLKLPSSSHSHFHKTIDKKVAKPLSFC